MNQNDRCLKEEKDLARFQKIKAEAAEYVKKLNGCFPGLNYLEVNDCDCRFIGVILANLGYTTDVVLEKDGHYSCKLKETEE